MRAADPQQDRSLSLLMASSYIAAIDAVIVAEEYARHKGVNFRVTTGEIRASAHCIFIERGKAIERHIREMEYEARYAKPARGTRWQQ